MLKRVILSLFLFLMFLTTSVFAQPTNDECEGAINIPNVNNWCSASGAYTNAGATPSSYGPATCFGPTTENDVWFTFTATATDVTLLIKGATPQATGGTLKLPKVSLYLGSCGGTINQLECQAASGNNLVEAYQGGLFVGATYLLRVQSSAANAGTFQMCINCYNAPIEPTSDCPTASLLCDKSPFVVQSVTGAGTDISEMDGATCFNNGAPTNFESNSTWFKWICSESGTLTFDLEPLSASDDLDFVIYRLPNGITGSCAGKQILRCMAAGDNAFPSPCMGPTGLRVGANDTEESAGCGGNKDNYLRPLDMVAGDVYALVINNFTSTGNGFSIEFGGSGEFLGPIAQFTSVPEAFCLGAPVTITDNSTFEIGSITKWSWSFGNDATPQTATGAGPHTVTFTESGIHSIALSVETNLKCRVTEIDTVIVYPPVEVDTLIAMPECNGGTNGQVSITNIELGTPPYQYSWNNGPFTASNTLTGLGVGVVSLVIKDANNCQTELDIPVEELKLTVDPDITFPQCFGFTDGSVTLNVTNGTGPYQFDFGSGFVPTNTQGGYASGDYTVLGLDAKLCKGTFNFTIGEHPQLELSMDTVHIDCFGADNGVGIATATGGFGAYTYQWTDGQTTAEASGLTPGQHDVTVSDGNECNIIGGVFITEPPELDIQLLGTAGVICFGDATGTAIVSASGGVPNYMYGANGQNYGTTDTLQNVIGGDNYIMVKDANGCVDSVFAYIPQPPQLIVSAEKDTTLVLGYTMQTNALTLPPGRPVTYMWTPPTGLSCTDCLEPLVTGTVSTTYVIKITDEDGCMAFDSIRVLVTDDRPIYIPNIFYPDNGTLFPNEKFTLFGGPAAESIDLLRIYDRWGELLYEGKNLPLGAPGGWDGTYKGEKMIGVFVFDAQVRFIDQKVLSYKGDVTVFR